MLPKFSRPSFRATLVLVTGLAAVAIARATTLIYPVEAIDDLWQLQADDFKTKYAGINITGLGPSDEGWYVRYRHENLTYMFGPLADNEAARKKKWDLETVRDAAIRNRPSLSTSKVDYVKFSYSGVYGKAGNTPYGGKKGDGSGTGDGTGDDKNGNGAGGKDGSGKDGSGNGNGDKLAGGDGTSDQNGDGTGDSSGGGKDGKGGKSAKAGKNGKGDSGDGTGDDDGGVVGAGKGGALQKVASAKGGGSKSGGGAGGQGGQQGQQGGQDGGQQGGQSGSQGGQQGGSGQSGGQSGGQPGGSGPAGGGSSGGGGNPLQLVGMLLKMILGL
jgi:hypothetical protein